MKSRVEVVHKGQISHPTAEVEFHSDSIELWIPEYRVDIEIEVNELRRWLEEWEKKVE